MKGQAPEHESSTPEIDSSEPANQEQQPTEFISQLWRNRITSILGQIAQEETEYEEVANLAEHIGADYHDRFLVELLQNAEDQSTKASLHDAHVVVIRTQTSIAVLNQGEPFSDKGIRSITSAGISPKDAQVSLGNKGIGFKAVFQVTDRPEVFTAPENGKNFIDGESLWFQMSTSPFDEPSIEKQARQIIKQTLAADKGLESKILALAKDKELVSYVLEKLRLAAPFKFPKILDRADLDAQLEELKIEEVLQQSMSTLVVLPLLDDSDTFKKVDKILDSFIQEKHPGSVLLFLKGVSRLEIRDHVRESHWIIERITDPIDDGLPRGASFSEVYLNSVQHTSTGNQSFDSLWWLAERRFGNNGADESTSKQEQNQIRAAVKKLPGKWEDVESAYAAVALPRFATDDERNRFELETDGKLCIGLPTTDPTGTPAWISGPFHGNISRTGIDLGADYNALIFNESISLFWDAIENLKTIGDKSVWQSITLYFKQTHGCLARALSNNFDLPSKELILSKDATAFLPACDIKIPTVNDIDHFRQFFSGIPEIELHHFILPDSYLMKHASDIISVLAEPHDPFVSQDDYLERTHPDGSLLERTAAIKRKSGPVFWEPFLNWCLLRYNSDALSEQTILPVSDGDLKCGDNRVFFLPVQRNSTNDYSELNKDENDTEEDSVEAMPHAISSDMRFFDNTCIKVRKDNSKTAYTDLASELTNTSPPLVLSPRRDQLIKEVLAPALERRSRKNPLDPDNFVLLDVIAKWVVAMTEKQRQELDLEILVVPVHDSNNAIVWEAPTHVYFGEGWLNTSDDALLQAAYADREKAMLLPWQEFFNTIINALGSEEPPSLDRWRCRMLKLGVADRPRILPFDPAKRRQMKPYLKANFTSHLSVNLSQSPPFDGVQTYWHEYLKAISTRPATTKSGYSYYIRPMIWIDGLEDEHRRKFIIEHILRRGSDYSSRDYLKSDIARHNDTDSTTVDSFWVYTLKTYAAKYWQVFPANNGKKELTSNLWLLTGSEKQRRFVTAGLVKYISDEFCNDHTLINSLGIYSPSNAPIERVIKEIHSLASRIESFQKVQLKSLGFYTETLYDWLQQRCNSDPGIAAKQLAVLLTCPVPMKKSEQVIAVDLKALDKIYLNDDPERAQHVQNFAVSYHLPISAKSASANLFNGLQTLLGPETVVRTSETKLCVNFDEDPGKPETLLGTYLTDELNANGINPIRDIACLLANGHGEQSMTVGGQPFHKALHKLDSTIVRFGHLGELDDDGVIYDERATGGSTLYVENDKTAIDIISALWHLYSRRWRLLFQAYSSALESGQHRLESFFKQQGITEGDWDLIDAERHQGKADAFTELKPGIFAVIRKANPRLTSEEFETQYTLYQKSVHDLADWLEIEQQKLDELIELASGVFDDSSRIHLAEVLGVPLEAWQSALDSLGRNRLLNPKSYTFFDNERCKLAAILFSKACDDDVSINHQQAQTFIEIIGLSNLQCPETLTWSIPTQTLVNKTLVDLAQEILREIASGDGLTLFEDFLNCLTEEKLDSDLYKLRFTGIRKKEVTLFNETKYAPPRRANQAKEEIAGILRVATALAEKYNIALDTTSIVEDAVLKRYTSDNWWGNRFAALRRLKNIFTVQSEDLAKMLQNENAFSGRRPWKDLWKRFELELGQPDYKHDDSTENTSNNTLDYSDKDDHSIELDLKIGSEGTIGKKFSELVDPNSNLAKLALQGRNSARQQTTIKRGKHGYSRSSPRDHSHDQLIGALGEIYVYEYFRKLNFSGFDHHCWVSENRERYGMSKPEESGQGYDFCYSDEDGRLTGRKNQPLCYIEVKSSADSGSDSFPMSINEWEQARLCHEDKKALYIIIRVNNVQTQPAISDVILDPYCLWKKKQLSIAKRDLSVYVGKPVSK